MTDDDLIKMMMKSFDAKPMEWSDEIYFERGDRTYCLMYTTSSSAAKYGKARNVSVVAVRLEEKIQTGNMINQARQIAVAKMYTNGHPVEATRKWIVKELLNDDIN